MCNPSLPCKCKTKCAKCDKAERRAKAEEIFSLVDPAEVMNDPEFKGLGCDSCSVTATVTEFKVYNCPYCEKGLLCIPIFGKK